MPRRRRHSRPVPSICDDTPSQNGWETTVTTLAFIIIVALPAYLIINHSLKIHGYEGSYFLSLLFKNKSALLGMAAASAVILTVFLTIKQDKNAKSLIIFALALSGLFSWVSAWYIIEPVLDDKHPADNLLLLLLIIFVTFAPIVIMMIPPIKFPKTTFARVAWSVVLLLAAFYMVTWIPSTPLGILIVHLFGEEFLVRAFPIIYDIWYVIILVLGMALPVIIFYLWWRSLQDS